jgi:hypothetical protein
MPIAAMKLRGSLLWELNAPAKFFLFDIHRQPGPTLSRTLPAVSGSGAAVWCKSKLRALPSILVPSVASARRPESGFSSGPLARLNSLFCSTLCPVQIFLSTSTPRTPVRFSIVSTIRNAATRPSKGSIIRSIRSSRRATFSPIRLQDLKPPLRG